MKSRYVVTCNAPFGAGTRTRAQEAKTQPEAMGIAAAMRLGLGAQPYYISIRRLSDGSMVKRFSEKAVGHTYAGIPTFVHWATPFRVVTSVPEGEAMSSRASEGQDSVDAAIALAAKLRSKLGKSHNYPGAFVYVAVRRSLESTGATMPDLVSWNLACGHWRRNGTRKVEREHG